MLKDLFEASKDRIKNPFISSFAIALIVLNWKSILIVVFSNLSIEERITCVEEYYIHWENYLLFPVLIAIFYTLILPYIMVGIDELLKTANIKKIEGYYAQEVIRTRAKSTLAAEEVNLELVKANSNDLTRANETIESLKKSNEHKDELLSELRMSYNELKTEHQKLQNERVTGFNYIPNPGTKGDKPLSFTKSSDDNVLSFNKSSGDNVLTFNKSSDDILTFNNGKVNNLTFNKSSDDNILRFTKLTDGSIFEDYNKNQEEKKDESDITPES